MLDSPLLLSISLAVAALSTLAVLGPMLFSRNQLPTEGKVSVVAG